MLYVVIFLFILSILYSIFTKKEPFSTDRPMKGCILLYGESFRLGGQNNRNRGTAESYDGQIQAAESHLSFMKEIQPKVEMDVYISTYETPYSQDLMNVYGEKRIGHDLYKELIGQTNLVKNALKKISIDAYDFILILRIDLFLKPAFIEVFDPTWNTIRWPSVCFKPFHKIGIHPKVSDMMCFIPKKYYPYLKNMNHREEAWAEFVENSHLTYADLDTMLDTFHDSDSAKDYNPLYYIVNRPQSTIHHTTEHFDKWLWTGE
jgi:hypothetical protein